MAETAGGELWDFSLRFYARPAATKALLALQDEGGRDVNLILFALWLGVSGRGRLDRRGLARSDRLARRLTRRMAAPLRTLRRRLKPDAAADVQAFRERVKELELVAEKLAQHRLAALAPAAMPGLGRAERLAAACDNLALCLGPAAAGSAETAALRRALAAFLG
ncbi:MAG TPA: TIGR02444 family protein [Stellaceae bacterium]|nr:TIGR02444 family protein [Stellaceae bacterium]